MKKINVQVIRNEDEPIEIIASSIVKLSEAMEIINKSSLSERAILLLLQDATGLPQRDIKKILFALPRLKEMYIKKIK